MDYTEWFDKTDKRKRLYIVGNSHSKDIFNVLVSSENASSSFQLGHFYTQIRLIDETFFDSKNYKLAQVVMLASRYSQKDTDALEHVISQVISDGKKVVLVRNVFEFDQFKVEKYNLADRLVQENSEIAADLQGDFVNKVNHQYYQNFKQGTDKLRLLKSTAQIDNLAKIYKGLIVLNRMDYICDRDLNQCFAINEKLEKFFYDYGHHTLEGAKFFGGRVDKVDWLSEVLL